MRRNIQFKVALALTLALTLPLVGGCAMGDQGDAQYVRGTTPELATMRQSEGQLKNTEARVINTDIRALRDDIHRALLLDQNTRLYPYPVP
jgi:hypothetical protein